MNKKGEAWVWALFIMIAIFCGIWLLLSYVTNCDNKGCKDKDGCYDSLRESNYIEFDECIEKIGWDWDRCKQECFKIDYSSLPKNYTLKSSEVYDSYLRAINISKNVSEIHFCDTRVIDNNLSCSGNEYWTYVGKYNTTELLIFK